MDEFYDHFLRDDASYSFDRFQKEKIHDRDVSITRWTNDSEKNSTPDEMLMQTRILSFTHPIKNTVGLGPSEAKTTRRQLLRRYQNLGITIENKTLVEGIPAADTFSVVDFWHIKSDGTDNVILSVSFEINFTKRTMFKNIIEKSVLRETGAWLLGYSEMIRDALANRKDTKTTSQDWPVTASKEISGVVANDLSRMHMIFFVALFLLIPCLIVMTMYLKILCKTAANINSELTVLRMLSAQILWQLRNE